ncbi:hypothetical protein Scep_026112 [Stephania cephalantha]|uniref:Uncharacterized protein n=1 Tax=Stephania cephalantha TaxID=152367 RepID=A0AAP0ERR4_9MAGN
MSTDESMGQGDPRRLHLIALRRRPLSCVNDALDCSTCDLALSEHQPDLALGACVSDSVDLASTVKDQVSSQLGATTGGNLATQRTIVIYHSKILLNLFWLYSLESSLSLVTIASPSYSKGKERKIGFEEEHRHPISTVAISNWDLQPADSYVSQPSVEMVKDEEADNELASGYRRVNIRHAKHCRSRVVHRRRCWFAEIVRTRRHCKLHAVRESEFHHTAGPRCFAGRPHQQLLRVTPPPASRPPQSRCSSPASPPPSPSLREERESTRGVGREIGVVGSWFKLGNFA